jgi:hypothetical protein
MIGHVRIRNFGNGAHHLRGDIYWCIAWVPIVQEMNIEDQVFRVNK